MPAPSFEKNIRPLFRDFDISSMKDYGIDLSAYADVKKHAGDIYTRLLDGEMPCDSAWSAENLTAFKEWMDGGMLP